MISKLIRFDVVNTKLISFIMKKIIALFVIMLGFGFTANAQQKKAAAKPATAAQAQTNSKDAAIQAAAIKDVNALNAYIPLNDADKQSFKGLFEYKHRLWSENLSEERKGLVSQTIDAKIKATLSSEQLTKLEANPKLLNTLTH
jgi:hypothetical protein